MNSYRPDLAIVITTFRRQELLKKLLNSIASQRIKPKKIFVVDNENSPATKRLVKSFKFTKYIGMSENTGGAGGFSRGVEEAYMSGYEWVWIMDDDVKVIPRAIEKLSKWTKSTENDIASGKKLSETVTVYQGLRKNFDDTFFYWQYDFWNNLAIPNPFAPNRFRRGEKSRPMNTACFEGGLFHRSIIKKIGLPDARFFIYWDDTIYGYLASKYTKMLLVTDYILQRTRVLENVKFGRVRRLNSTSDMTRYYIMRNRGFISHYLRLNGDYNRFIFGLGTFLTFCKETIRLCITKSFMSGLPRLWCGWRDSRKIIRDTEWKPYSKVKSIKETK